MTELQSKETTTIIQSPIKTEKPQEEKGQRNSKGQFIEGHKSLTPLKFKTPEELRERIESYWKNCEEKEEPITISGLAVWLDTNRQTLVNYNKSQPYFDIIKKARAICEAFLEKAMLGRKYNVIGAIFTLKNNYGWTDKKEVITNPDKPDSFNLDL